MPNATADAPAQWLELLRDPTVNLIRNSFVGVLSDAQFSALWAAFGISDLLIADYEDKYCREPGTCAKEGGSICTSTC